MRMQVITEDNMAFMEKLLSRSGIGGDAYMPEGSPALLCTTLRAHAYLCTQQH